MHEQVTPTGKLFTRTWTLYKQRALPMLAVILISTVLISSLVLVMVLCGSFGGALLIHFMEDMTGISIIAAFLTLFLLVITILIIWCQTSFIAIIVDEELGIIEAFQRGWEYIWPMTWVVTFLSGILITGFSFGILPGFLFLVWFSFCAFILLEEDRRGLDSLLASKEYVRGHWWNTFGKLALIWLISAIAGIIPFLGMFLSILLAPFCMLYMLLMYRDLKAVKGTAEPGDQSAGKVFWWVVTVIGLILPVAALIGLLYYALTGELQLIAPGWQGSHGISM